MSAAPERASANLSSLATHNAAASLGARLASLVIGMILTPFVLHRMGRDLYGVAAAAGSVLEYLWLLRGGLGTAMRRYVTVNYHSGDRGLADRYYSAGFWWSALLRLAVLVAGVSLAHGLCRFMHVEERLLADATVGLALLFLAAAIGDLGTILEVPVYATGHTSPASAVRGVGALLRLGLVVPAFLLFVPSLAVYAGAVSVAELLVAVAIGVVAARTRVVRSVIPRPDFGASDLRRELFRFGSFSVVSQVAAILYLATDNLLIGGIYGPGRVTEYSLGTRWAPMITGFLWAGVSALTPLVTRLEATGETERTRHLVLRAAAVNSALGVPVCLVPCIVGDVFLANWVGPEYRRSAVYMIAMLVPTMVSLTLEPMWMAMVARGHVGRIALGDIIVAVVNPILSLVLALPLGLGLLGFALGNTVALLARNLVLRPLMGKSDPALPSMGKTLLALPAALAGGAPALLLLYFARPLYSHSLAAVMLAGLASGVLCLAGATLTAVGWKDTRRIVASLTGRSAG